MSQIDVKMRGEISFDSEVSYLSFGDSKLDEELSIERGSTVMFFGAPFTGKTSFCISASIAEIINEGKVFYIDSEGGVSPARIRRIAKAKHIDLERLVERLKLIRVRNLKELLGYAGYAIRSGYDLVIMDSISRPYLVELKRHNSDELEMDVYTALIELQEEAMDNETSVIVVSEVRRKRNVNELKDFDPHDMLFLDDTPWPISTLGSVAKNAIGLIIVKKRRFAFIERHLSRPSIYEDMKYIEFRITDQGVKYVGEVDISSSSISYRVNLY